MVSSTWIPAQYISPDQSEHPPMSPMTVLFSRRSPMRDGGMAHLYIYASGEAKPAAGARLKSVKLRFEKADETRAI